MALDGEGGQEVPQRGGKAEIDMLIYHGVHPLCRISSFPNWCMSTTPSVAPLREYWHLNYCKPDHLEDKKPIIIIPNGSTGELT